MMEPYEFFTLNHRILTAGDASKQTNSPITSFLESGDIEVALKLLFDKLRNQIVTINIS